MLNINILTCSMLRYSTHAPNHKPLLHCILISDEDTYLIPTSYSFPKLRQIYRAHAVKCKHLHHCTESLKRDIIELFS